MDKFIIQKFSRLGFAVDEHGGYSGPTCAEAGVELGKVYTSRADAKADAQRLSQFNPVGFCVIEVGKKWREAVRDYYHDGRKMPIPNNIRKEGGMA